MTTHDPDALTRLLAEALASTLDTWGHMPYCQAWRGPDVCTYDPCQQVRAAVAAAREAGILAQEAEKCS